MESEGKCLWFPCYFAGLTANKQPAAWIAKASSCFSFNFCIQGGPLDSQASAHSASDLEVRAGRMVNGRIMIFENRDSQISQQIRTFLLHFLHWPCGKFSLTGPKGMALALVAWSNACDVRRPPGASGATPSDHCGSLVPAQHSGDGSAIHRETCDSPSLALLQVVHLVDGVVMYK